MNNIEYKNGDIVYSKSEIRNDGSVPELPENALIALFGARGVVINHGHIEEFPDKQLYLVKFENENSELGIPVGVWPEEITQEPLLNS